LFHTFRNEQGAQFKLDPLPGRRRLLEPRVLPGVLHHRRRILLRTRHDTGSKKKGSKNQHERLGELLDV
jgi:hypothetical protein